MTKDEFLFVSGEDTTCNVWCLCGYEHPIWCTSHEINSCPQCKRGFKSEFIVWTYNENEVEEEISNA